MAAEEHRAKRARQAPETFNIGSMMGQDYRTAGPDEAASHDLRPRLPEPPAAAPFRVVQIEVWRPAEPFPLPQGIHMRGARSLGWSNRTASQVPAARRDRAHLQPRTSLGVRSIRKNRIPNARRWRRASAISKASDFESRSARMAITPPYGMRRRPHAVVRMLQGRLADLTSSMENPKAGDLGSGGGSDRSEKPAAGTSSVKNFESTVWAFGTGVSFNRLAQAVYSLSPADEGPS